jgi:3,4-dihydroxy 2-butanone 4-phosphate synthase/GTP cyclohydrolase II
MSAIDQAVTRIRAFAAAQGWRKSRLAKEAGMQDTTLRNFDDPDWNPTLETVRRLEALIPADFEPPRPTGFSTDIAIAEDAA